MPVFLHKVFMLSPNRYRRSALSILLFAIFAVLNTRPSNAYASPTLKLKRVSLSSSGVGYFEYEAQVSGSAILKLPIALNTVDDALKSLVIYDTQGRIGGVSLSGLDPLTHTLKQLPFDANALQSTDKLLAALRGTEISVGGKTSLRGRIVAVHTIAATNKEAEKHAVTLMTAQGLQTFILETADNLQFEDTVLREQIQRALLAMSSNRAQDSRTLEIVSEGTSDRTVRIGYVTSVPIWKNAYRLTLPSADDTQASTSIQGWAVLENMSGHDWPEVQLTLTAGKPVAFSQKLYPPYYNTRPNVALELPNNIVPVADTGTFKNTADITAQTPAPVAPMIAMAMMAPSAKLARSTDKLNLAEQKTSDTAEPASDATTVQELSTQAHYTFNLPVTVSNGRSLSIPIIQETLPIRRVALYQPNVNRQFPLAAIELKNTTPNTLPAGAVTLYETTSNGNQFVGDAQLNVLPPNDIRYVAYALDQKLSVAHSLQQNNKVKRYSVHASGVLHTDYVYQTSHVFTVKSNHQNTQDMIVEVPIQTGDWALVPHLGHTELGKTPTHYRRKITINPNETLTADVRQERVATVTQALDTLDANTLQDILNNINQAELAPKDKPILERVLALVKAHDAMNERINIANEALNAGRENQKRIRENLKSVPVKSDPHSRYMVELNKADEQDARLQTELAIVQAKQREGEATMQAYLNGLK
jgi:hypothetical protein